MSTSANSGLYEDGFQKETWALMAGTLALSIFASIIGGAAPALMLGVLPAAYFTFVKAPLHISMRAYLVLGLFIEQPEMNPGCNYWVSPLNAANHMMFTSLKNLDIVPVPISLFAMIALVLTYRGVRKKRIENAMPAPKLALRYATLVGLTVVAFEIYGIVRGGKFPESIFQTLPLLTTPFVVAAFVLAVRGRQDLYSLASIIVSVAVARCMIVVWVYFVVCMPQGFRPEYATTHCDSTTFAAGLLILVAHALELRSTRTYVRLALVGGLILVGMVMNNRRLAFASTAMAIVAMYFTLPPSSTRKRVNKYILTMGPLAALYTFVGETIDHPVFAPARLALSAFSQKDDSSASRVIENENLLATLNDAPLFGQGFGFEYKEVVKLYDISEFFALYRYLPHNSILWLWSAVGVVGFAFLWLGYLGAAYLSARAFRWGETALERASALACLGIVATCVSQDWGDIGSHSAPKILVYAVAFAVGAKICGGAELKSRMQT
jgi:O-Antigen ligase